MLSPQDYFKLDKPFTAQFFQDCAYVWQPLAKLELFIQTLVGHEQNLFCDLMPGVHLSDRPVFIAEDARIEPGAYILGPAYIGSGVTIRHGAYIRENVILLDGSTVGHASEVKNSLLLPGAQAPHFNYVGDSILGHHTNLGAGTKLSNLTIISEKDRATGKRPTIKITYEKEIIDTELAKFGAILGDDSQTGCNSVLNPGCILGPRSLVYANLSLRKGVHPPDSIIKLRQKTSNIPRTQ